MRKVLKRAFIEMELEIYFYCLGIIPPITFLFTTYKKEFTENNFI